MMPSICFLLALFLPLSLFLTSCSVAQDGAMIGARKAYHAERCDLVLQSLRNAESYKKPSPDLQAEIFYIRALCLEKLSRKAEAIGLYRYIVEKFPDSAFAVQAKTKFPESLKNPGSAKERNEELSKKDVSNQQTQIVQNVTDVHVGDRREKIVSIESRGKRHFDTVQELDTTKKKQSLAENKQVSSQVVVVPSRKNIRLVQKSLKELDCHAKFPLTSNMSMVMKGTVKKINRDCLKISGKFLWGSDISMTIECMVTDNTHTNRNLKLGDYIRFTEMNKKCWDIVVLRSSNAKAEEKTDQGPQREKVRWVQQKLMELGYTPGPIDGIMGKATKSAMRKLMQTSGLGIPEKNLFGNVIVALKYFDSNNTYQSVGGQVEPLKASYVAEFSSGRTIMSGTARASFTSTERAELFKRVKEQFREIPDMMLRAMMTQKGDVIIVNHEE